MLETKYLIQYKDIIADVRNLLTFLPVDSAVDSRWSSYALRMSSLMIQRVNSSVVCVSDSEVTTTENADVYEFEEHYKAVLNMTMTKYISLIAGMEANKTALLDVVKTTDTSQNWYNDTPQIDTSSGESEDLSHLSTYTKNKNVNESAVGTPAARLAEIESSISHYWKAWTDEIIHLLHLEE